jgi:hypothetical protein
VRIARQQALQLIRILLVPSIFELIGKICILFGVQLLASKDHANLLNSIPNGLLLLVGLLVCAIAEFVLTLRQLALVRLYLGVAQSYEEAYEFVFQRKFTVLSGIAVIYGLMVFALVFWSVEIGLCSVFLKQGALAVFAAIAILFGVLSLLGSILVVSLPASVVFSAIALDRRTFATVISNVVRLVFSSFLRTIYFNLALIVCVLAISNVLNAPPLIVTAIEYTRNAWAGHVTHDPLKQVSMFAQVFASVWRSCTNMVVSPIVFLSCGFYYFDLRIRRDGLDLSLQLKDLAADNK